MKSAVIIVGRPNAGKSTTIREFKTTVTAVSFHEYKIGDKIGYVLSYSFETRCDVDETINKLSEYDYLLFASQGEELETMHKVLNKAGFSVNDVNIQRPSDAPEKAKEVLRKFAP